MSPLSVSPKYLDITETEIVDPNEKTHGDMPAITDTDAEVPANPLPPPTFIKIDAPPNTHIEITGVESSRTPPPQPPTPPENNSGGGGNGWGGKWRGWFTRRERPIKRIPRDSVFWFWVGVAVVYSILFAIEAFVLRSKVFDLPFGWGASNWGEVLFLLQVVYTTVSFHELQAEEIGARLLFGNAINNLRSGLVFIPRGICTLRRLPKKITPQELPADPENIFRGEDTVPVPEGKFPPIRVKFIENYDGKDPLTHGLTTEVVIVVRWRIIDPCAFIQHIGDEEKCKVQMLDAVVGVANEKLAKVTASYAITHIEEFNKQALDAVTQRLHVNDPDEDWGVHVESVQFKSIPLAHTLNTAIQSIPLAEATAQSSVIAADANKKVLQREGEGKGRAERIQIVQRAAGIKKAAQMTKLSPEILLGAETAERITSNPGQKTVIVGTNGLSQLIGAATGVADTLRGQNTNVIDDAPPSA